MSPPDARELFAPDALENPYPCYARLREAGPLCEVGKSGVFFVSTWDAVEEAARRHAEFSANLTGVLVAGEGGLPEVFELAGAGTASEVIATADEPAHAVQRRIVQPVLAERRIASLEAELRRFAAGRIAAFARAGGGDWCDAVAEPLPAFALMHLLGLGEPEIEAARRWAMMGGDLLAGRIGAERMARLLAETAEMSAFLERHLGRALAAPPAARGESLCAALAAGVESGAVSREQAVGILVILFGAAGESTASLLGSAVRLLASDPELQQALRRAPARLPDFVEEAVRLESPFRFHYRVVKQPASLCGVQLEPGQRLMLSWASANRDPAAFSRPDEVALPRAQGRRHLGFGRGVHFCVGAPLARLEARVALEELLAGTRCFALDPERPPAHVPSIFVRRLAHLQLRLE
jgi:cytochrome P450